MGFDSQNWVKVLQGLILLTTFTGCFDKGKSALEWDTIKSEIRNSFPTVRQISTQELADWLSADNGSRPLLLDARSNEEFAVSHLPDAILVRSETEALKFVQGDQPVVVYCSVGYRSSRLARQLAELGLAEVYNLEGSIFQWANEGKPLYRGNDRVTVVHPFDEHWGTLLGRELWSYEPR